MVSLGYILTVNPGNLVPSTDLEKTNVKHRDRGISGSKIRKDHLFYQWLSVLMKPSKGRVRSLKYLNHDDL